MNVSRLGLVVDFDGTIAEIAPTPDEARISAVCAETLDRLSQKLTVVSVVSGRSIEDLYPKVQIERLVYFGNHGAEILEQGNVTLAQGACQAEIAIEPLFNLLFASADGPGMVWQNKGFSASVHYRTAPNPRAAKNRLSAVLADIPIPQGIEFFWGKQVLEIRSSAGLHKGSAVTDLIKRWRLQGLIFIGDDMTDVDGMRALKGLNKETQFQSISVAVVDDDSPSDLLSLADCGVMGVTGTEELLRCVDSMTC